MKILKIFPYVAILGANFLYIYAFNYDPQEDKIQIFLFNFVIMLLIGIVGIIKVNMILHQLLIVEGEQDDKGNLTTKGHWKKKIKNFLKYNNMVSNIFLPGNQFFLLKIYLGIAIFKWVTSFLPGLFSGLILSLYFQFKGLIYQKGKPFFDYISTQFSSSITLIVDNLPQYKEIRQKKQ